jgi:hypothetical protein
MDKKDLAQDKKMIKSAVGKHEKNMHPGKTPTNFVLVAKQTATC